MSSDNGSNGTGQTPIWNFVTFQIWAASILGGVLASTVTGNLDPLTTAPLIGLIAGVVVNELLPGFVNEGVRIV